MLVNLPNAMTIQIGSLNSVWLKISQFNLFYKIVIVGFGFLFLKKENQISEIIPKNAGEDHRVALLRRQHARLVIDVYIRKVGIGLVLHEWI
jgi:hypothetical protein